MNSAELVLIITRLLDDFLEGKLEGEEMISKYDDILANQFDYDKPDDTSRAIDKFQIDLSLFVPKEANRSEDPHYYGPDELKRKVKSFRSTLPR